jgi:hypothetical protein
MKDISGYEGLYAACKNGGIWSHGGKSNHREGYFLQPKIDKHGYLKVNLSRNGFVRSRFVDRLIAEAFIPNPEDKKQVNHKDGHKSNCSVNNLEWSTAKENSDHAFDLGLKKHYERGSLGRFTSVPIGHPQVQAILGL